MATGDEKVAPIADLNYFDSDKIILENGSN